ncbi:protein WVD2-like 7 [Phalaenopsis equestris]|uniref:protein WVD2-like 7 n=1 Tax=Phalaenopsis equestris TaxID=78828 RepID=UPI0009E3045D|nr:protein WVD2-like 7 [Phalaenopsis equestris]XP_020572563.1 protein WVD2-like 7 [Phalaenopsis equestris]
MAGEVEECIAHQSGSLPSGSISFGRFDLGSLSWEKRSTFSHNRYLEEVEKYSTPGSVTRKKEYFEAHFKKKALLHQVSEENEKGNESKHVESIVVHNDGIIKDFVFRGNEELVEVSRDDKNAPSVLDDSEIFELQKEEMSSAELNMGFSSLNSEEYAEPFNEHSAFNVVKLDEGGSFEIVEDKAVDDSGNIENLAENGDVSLNIIETKKNNEAVKMKSQKVSTKSSATVDAKAGKSQFKAHLSKQQMPKKASKNGNSISCGKIKKADKQNIPIKLEKSVPSKVPFPTSAENGNFKTMASRNMKTKTSSEIKSVESVKAKKAEVMPHLVERRGSDVPHPVNRVKSSSKAEDKQSPAAFKFKSSERAEKRKEYYLKLEEKLHTKVAEMNEIQARTEEIKEAEMKQFRKSLNFKATPMPSFYLETTKLSEVKKTSTTLSKSPITPSKSSTPLTQPSSTSNQQTPPPCEFTHDKTQPISPSISIATEKVRGTETSNHSSKKPVGSRGEEKVKFNSLQSQGNGMRKKVESKGLYGKGFSSSSKSCKSEFTKSSQQHDLANAELKRKV